MSSGDEMRCSWLRERTSELSKSSESSRVILVWKEGLKSERYGIAAGPREASLRRQLVEGISWGNWTQRLGSSKDHTFPSSRELRCQGRRSVSHTWRCRTV